MDEWINKNKVWNFFMIHNLQPDFLLQIGVLGTACTSNNNTVNLLEIHDKLPKQLKVQNKKFFERKKVLARLSS